MSCWTTSREWSSSSRLELKMDSLRNCSRNASRFLSLSNCWHVLSKSCGNGLKFTYNEYCTTPNKILAIWLVKSARRRVKKFWMSHAPGMRHPPWLSHASDVITINVTITALRIIVDLRDLLAHRNCFVNEIRVTLWSHARWLYLATEGENKICPARTAKVKSSWTVFAFLCSRPHSNSRLYNQIRKHSRCRTKQIFHLRAVQWQGLRIQWKIVTHCSTQLRFVEQCVAIFHLMRNPWPSHGSAWNICLLYSTK